MVFLSRHAAPDWSSAALMLTFVCAGAGCSGNGESKLRSTLAVHAMQL
jgi:hypothetical protein